MLVSVVFIAFFVFVGIVSVVGVFTAQQLFKAIYRIV